MKKTELLKRLKLPDAFDGWQPGYGTSYVTGKYLIDELIKDRAHQLGDAFTMRRFFDEFNAAGVIPVSLIRWQMTARRQDR